MFGLQDVTVDLFGAENVGTVAAFGDFNSDKQTDIFVIREGEYRLSLLLANANISLCLQAVYILDKEQIMFKHMRTYKSSLV